MKTGPGIDSHEFDGSDELDELISDVLSTEAVRAKESATRNPQSIVKVRHMVHDATVSIVEESYGMPLVHAVRDLRHRSRCRARARTIRTLTRIVARLAEKHVATSAWLFLLQPDSKTLVANVTHNTDNCGLEMDVEGNGVVPHVARKKSGLLLADVSQCTFYKNTVESTRSEVAVPVTVPGTDDRILGVLNLESDMLGKFTNTTLDDLNDQVGELIIHILCLRSMDAHEVVKWPWHPNRNGWGVGEVLDDICHAMSTALCPKAPNTVTATIWCADWEKRVLYVRGTNGYDYDFIADQMLPFESFTGEIVARRPGEVVCESPDYPNFREWEKASDMGLTRIISVPLFRTDGMGEQHHAIGALNIYFLNGMRLQHIPSRTEMQQIAQMIGKIVQNLMSLRDAVACSYLHARLCGDRREWECMSFWDLHATTIREVFTDCLCAEGCTVFAFDDQNRELVGIETTGVRPTINQGDEEYALLRFGNREFPRFKMDVAEDEGLMSFLVMNAGVPVRKHSILNLDEEGTPPGLPRRIVERHFERLSNDTKDRRFLGVGLASKDRPLGAIRLVRSEKSPPFTKADERLLMALVSVVMQVFEDMVNNHHAPGLSSTRVHKPAV